VVLDPAELSAGREPKVAWRDADGVLHAGSKRISLTGGDVFDVAVLGDRIVTAGLDGASKPEIQVRDASGSITARYPREDGRLVTNRDHTIVAWVAPGGVVTVLQDGHDQPMDLTHPSRGAQVEAIAVTGHDCFKGPEEVVGGGCSVYISVHKDTSSTPMVASSHGFTERVGSTLTELMDASDTGALVGIRNPTSRRLCTRYESEKTSYDNCDFLASSFSPDGKRLVAYPPVVTEGVATNQISLREAKTGRNLATVRSPKGTYSIYRAVWEDNTHVLLSIADGEDGWSIVRVGIDGTAETAVAPRTGAYAGLVDALAVQP
jgi:hypothetical protein